MDENLNEWFNEINQIITDIIKTEHVLYYDSFYHKFFIGPEEKRINAFINSPWKRPDEE